VIFELNMMPVAFQGLVSSHPTCEPGEQWPGNFGEWMQREAIADSADDDLEFSQ